jgi:hypothetical protein
MSFEGVDFLKIENNSKNVFEYFISRNFEKIDKFKKEKLKFYAEKYGIKYNEVLKLYDTGINEGIVKVQNEIRERDVISSEAGKYYLFEIATIYNIHAKYVGGENKFFFRKHFGTTHDPKLIKAIGKIIGEYEFAWQQVLKNHAVFEPLFKPEVEKWKNSVFNRPPYPCHNVEVIGLPDTMQKAKDFRQTLIQMDNVLKAKLAELLKNDLSNLALYRLFNYGIIDDLQNQCYEFLQETNNNIDNDVFNKYSRYYNCIKEDLNNCLNTFEELKDKGVFSIDMSSFSEFYLHENNWFKIIYEEFTFTKDSFLKITKSDKQSELIKIIETIAHVCIDIIEDPKDNYELFKSSNPDNDDRENKRTRRIMSKSKYSLKSFIDFQHRIGVSATDKQKRAGTVDLAFIKKDKTVLTIGEAINSKNLNSDRLGIGKQIIDHLNKLIDNYNKSGKDNLLFLVYYEGENYYTSFKNYLENIKECREVNSTCIEIKEITKNIVENSNVVKIAKSKHSYSKNTENLFNIYHFYINFGNTVIPNNLVRNNTETLDSTEEVRIIKEELK